MRVKDPKRIPGAQDRAQTCPVDSWELSYATGMEPLTGANALNPKP